MALVLLVSILLGCGPFLEDTMVKPATPRPLMTSNDRALIVFFRKETNLVAHYIPAAISDGDGNMVAALRGDEHAVIEVTPGHHVFYAFCDVDPNGVAIDADVAAGKVYFVHVSIEESFASIYGDSNPNNPQRQAMYSANAAMGAAGEFGASVRTLRLIPLHAGSNAQGAALARSTVQLVLRPDVARKIEKKKGWRVGLDKARAAEARYTPVQKALHHLSPDDGIGRSEGADSAAATLHNADDGSLEQNPQ